MGDIAEATPEDVRRAWRTWLAAAYRHACAIDLLVSGWAAPPGFIEELETRARLERAAYDEIRRGKR